MKYTLLQWIPYEGYEHCIEGDLTVIRDYMENEKKRRPKTFYFDDYWLVQDGPDWNEFMNE